MQPHWERENLNLLTYGYRTVDCHFNSQASFDNHTSTQQHLHTLGHLHTSPLLHLKEAVGRRASSSSSSSHGSIIRQEIHKSLLNSQQSSVNDHPSWATNACLLGYSRELVWFLTRSGPPSSFSRYKRIRLLIFTRRLS